MSLSVCPQRFCSETSRQQGVDPIGSARRTHAWLVIEYPLPWDEPDWPDGPLFGPIFEQIGVLMREKGIFVRTLVIAPDQAYADPQGSRVLILQQPAALFASYSQVEYIVPEDKILPLAMSFMADPLGSQFRSGFEADEQPNQAIRDLMICTHGNVDVACARFGNPIYQQLRQTYSHASLRVWRCSHFGGHQFAPTLLDLPTGHCWGHLDPQALNPLVNHQGSVSSLRSYYRGWCGLASFEQMAEREIWIQQGWEWLNYYKQGRTLSQGGDLDQPDWAEVEIDFASPDGQTRGSYQARIEVCGEVLTQTDSGEDQPLESVKQYQVASLSKLS